MKKLGLLALALVWAVPAFAQNVTTSSTAVGGHGSHAHTVSIPDKADQDTTRQDWGYGVKSEIVVYESPTAWAEEVRVDTSYDVQNRETRAFVVVKTNLWQALKG